MYGQGVGQEARSLGNVTAAPVRQGEITEVLNQLNNQLQILQDGVVQLGQRLQGLIRMEPEKGTSNTPPRITMNTAIGRQLDAHSERVEQMNTVIQALLQRLEI